VFPQFHALAPQVGKTVEEAGAVVVVDVATGALVVVVGVLRIGDSVGLLVAEAGFEDGLAVA